MGDELYSGHLEGDDSGADVTPLFDDDGVTPEVRAEIAAKFKAEDQELARRVALIMRDDTIASTFKVACEAEADRRLAPLFAEWGEGVQKRVDGRIADNSY